MQATWIADVLRDAGCTVVEYDGWKTRGHGDFTSLTHLVWHHDASPVGDSPGVPGSMLRRWDTAAAQLWVDRYGVWHVLAAGVAYHAGAVLKGKPGNRQSLGIETDHTNGEDWPEALITSLRVGSKALLTKMGRTAANSLEFHKTICSPKGRKVDPDGLDLDGERRAVDGASNALRALELGERVLGRGDRGADVVQLQAHFESLVADGIFGATTERVIRDFQIAHGLVEDGLVGPNTLALIRELAGPNPVTPAVPVNVPVVEVPPAPAPVPVPQEDDVDRLPVLRRGASGQAARNLQGLLVAAGRKVSIDGAFGAGTEAVLKEWQGAANAPGGADGVAGPGTWGRLLGLR